MSVKLPVETSGIVFKRSAILAIFARAGPKSLKIGAKRFQKIPKSRMNDQLEKSISFGKFELDPDRRRLLKGGEPVALHAKTFDLLVFLTENKGRVVSKDEILDAVWAGQFVEEANLSVQISALRKALGDSTQAPRFLVTVPGKGYKFIADVHAGGDEIVVETHKIERVVLETDFVASKNDVPVFAPNRRRNLVLGLSAIALMGVGVFLFRALTVSSGGPITSIAVLPFKPLVENERNESLELGMADTLIAKLSGFEELSVRPISAVRKYSNADQDAVAAGREQQVDAVLDGSIQQSGPKIRMTLRLVRVKDGSLLWTNQFDESVTDIFRLQDSISERVADALEIRLTNLQKDRIAKRFTEDTEAYQLYLLGRFHFAKRRRDAVLKSVEYFDQALQKDPNYALAYTAKGAAFSVLGWYEFIPPHEAYPKATAAIEKALELDNTIAEAYGVRGNIKRNYDWDLPGSESDYLRALELEPNNATIHHWYGLALSLDGRFDEGLAELKRAQHLDPLSIVINNAVGGTLSFARRFDEAIAQYRHVLELEPDYPFAYIERGTCYFLLGRPDEAKDEWLKGISLLGDNQQEVGALRAAYDSGGPIAFFRGLVEQTKQRGAYVSSYNVAVFYAGAGDKEQALDWLEKAYAERSPGMVAINVELFFDNLRSEPRFLELKGKIGI